MTYVQFILYNNNKYTGCIYRGGVVMDKKQSNNKNGVGEMSKWINHVLRMIDAGEVHISREAALRKPGDKKITKK